MSFRYQRRLVNSWLNLKDHSIQFLGSEIDKSSVLLRKYSGTVGTSFDIKFISMGELTIMNP